MNVSNINSNRKKSISDQNQDINQDPIPNQTYEMNLNSSKLSCCNNNNHNNNNGINSNNNSIAIIKEDNNKIMINESINKIRELKINESNFKFSKSNSLHNSHINHNNNNMMYSKNKYNIPNNTSFHKHNFNQNNQDDQNKCNNQQQEDIFINLQHANNMSSNNNSHQAKYLNEPNNNDNLILSNMNGYLSKLPHNDTLTQSKNLNEEYTLKNCEFEKRICSMRNSLTNVNVNNKSKEEIQDERDISDHKDLQNLIKSSNQLLENKYPSNPNSPIKLNNILNSPNNYNSSPVQIIRLIKNEKNCHRVHNSETYQKIPKLAHSWLKTNPILNSEINTNQQKILSHHQYDSDIKNRLSPLQNQFLGIHQTSHSGVGIDAVFKNNQIYDQIYGNPSSVQSGLLLKQIDSPINKLNTYSDQNLDINNVSRDEIEKICTPLIFQDYDLQAKINEVEIEDEIIHLPNHPIKINTLVIKKPIKIIGGTTSLLEVNETILIDLSNYPKPDKHVVFCECSIKYEHNKKKVTPNNSISTKRSKESEECKNSDKKSYSDNAQLNYISGQLTTEINKSNQNSLSDDKTFPLFTICANSTLEMLDCNIKSFNNTVITMNNLLSSHSHLIQDICFYLRYPKGHKLKDGYSNVGLILQSCVITNFWSGIQNTTLCNIAIEKSYLTESKCHAINISNPMKFILKDSVIEKPTKSCVNIRFSKDIDHSIKRMVIIENNELNHSQTYGLSIFGENMIPHQCQILIKNNCISNCRKDGIGIKNLNCNNIQIISNFIKSNHGNGIFLEHVLDSITLSQVKLAENKIQQCKLYGLIIIDVSTYNEKDEIFHNDKGGIILSGGDEVKSLQEIEYYKIHPIRNIFMNINISNNKNSGVMILGTLKGPSIFNACDIVDNTNGIYIQQKFLEKINCDILALGDGYSGGSPGGAAGEISHAHYDHSEIILTNIHNGKNKKNIDQILNKNFSHNDISLGQIILEKCNIMQNHSTGIYLKTILDKLYIVETTIQENRTHAIYIGIEDDKNKLIFKEADKGRVREYISGFVGGEWGMIYDESNSSCKGNKCNIF